MGVENNTQHDEARWHSYVNYFVEAKPVVDARQRIFADGIRMFFFDETLKFNFSKLVVDSLMREFIRSLT